MVDCAQARCELGDSGIGVLRRRRPGRDGDAAMRLAPHVFMRRGETLIDAVGHRWSVLHCSAAIASGEPLRRAEATRVIVRMDERCGGGARNLRWTVNGEPAEVQRVENERDGVYVQLGIGEIEDAQATVTASRPEPDGSVIAVARARRGRRPSRAPAIELPRVRADRLHPHQPRRVRARRPGGDHVHLVVLPIEGVYRVMRTGEVGQGTTRIRGESSAGGFVALRFGYRVDTLPEVVRVDRSGRARRAAAASAARGQRPGAARRLDARGRPRSSS